ncbi:hypothetical protein ACSBR1_042962 [Camellia fascicularis]
MNGVLLFNSEIYLVIQSNIVIMTIWMPGLKFSCIKMSHTVIPGSFNLTINSSQNFPLGFFDGGLSMLLIFISKYKVPWIFKWQYAISDNLAIRQHFVKWWDNFKPQRIIDQVQEEFPVNLNAPTSAMVKAQQNPIASVTQGTQGSPIPPVRLGSPTTSFSKPKSSKSKSAQSKPKAKTKSSSDELI